MSPTSGNMLYGHVDSVQIKLIQSTSVTSLSRKAIKLLPLSNSQPGELISHCTGCMCSMNINKVLLTEHTNAPSNTSPHSLASSHCPLTTQLQHDTPHYITADRVTYVEYSESVCCGCVPHQAADES